jgi:preprotein translocase subunit SecG
MYGLLLSLLVLDGILLIVVILLQAGKGGGLAAMGGGVTATEGILGGRQATTVLTRATWVMGGLFMVLAFVLSIMSSRAAQPTSILRDDAPVTAPTPVLPGGDAQIPGLDTDAGATGGETPPPSDPGADGSN